LFILSFKFSKPEISEEFSQVLPTGAYAFQNKGQKIPSLVKSLRDCLAHCLGRACSSLI